MRPVFRAAGGLAVDLQKVAPHAQRQMAAIGLELHIPGLRTLLPEIEIGTDALRHRQPRGDGRVTVGRKVQLGPGQMHRHR